MSKLKADKLEKKTEDTQSQKILSIDKGKVTRADGSYFYTENDTLVKEVVIPLIAELKEGLSISRLNDLILKNIEFVCTALFVDALDYEKIDQFIQKYNQSVDDHSPKQVGVYNAFYKLSFDIANSSKTADGRWNTYKEVGTNCKYMHLLSLVVDNMEVEDFLLGELGVTHEVLDFE